MKPGRFTLRTRLVLGAVGAAAIALAVLITAFNLALSARLRTDADNALRERANTVLRGLSTIDGTLAVPEAPDAGSRDTQTWIFARGRALEQPAHVDPRNQAAAVLAQQHSDFLTVDATDTRLLAVPVRANARQLGTVVVGASLSPYKSTASTALTASMILGLLVLAATIPLALWLIDHALRPVAVLTRRASEWGEHSLSTRFYAGEPHDELSALASVFDRLLSRLADSLRREQRLTAEISHELRTPLAKISAQTELARGRTLSGDEHGKALDDIARHAHELRRVLDTLLDSARAAHPKQRVASDARLAAAQAAQRMSMDLAASGKTVEVTCDGPVRVAAEAELVECILAPLLDNAARFAESRVEVRLHRDSAFVYIDVSDDGPGVPDRDRERIFEPGFSSGEDGGGTGDGHQGAGLGLSLVRRLARAAGGDVEARQGAGRGASFRVRLPS